MHFFSTLKKYSNLKIFKVKKLIFILCYVFFISLNDITNIYL